MSSPSSSITTPTCEIIRSADDKEDLCVHTWTPSNPSSNHHNASAIAVIYHGFLAHSRYPTVRYAAELLVEKLGMPVVAADARGHGKSTGMRGYLPGRDILIQDAIQVANYAVASSKQNNDNVKLFLLGSSMGGTIALTVAQALQHQQQKQHQQNDETKAASFTIAGVVLLAPMLKLKVDAASQFFLSCLSYIIPTLSVIPSSSTSLEVQYRDPEKRKECEQDEYSTKSSTIRVGSAATCVDLANQIQSEFSNINLPFLLMIADEDVVVQPDTTLFDQAPESVDKQLKRYPALHGLLCESQPLLDTIHSDIVAWIKARM